MPELVSFPKQNLQDIPSKLRQLADQIEASEYGEVSTLFILMPRVGDYPNIFGFGSVDAQNDPMIQLQLALHWFCNNLVNRT